MSQNDIITFYENLKKNDNLKRKIMHSYKKSESNKDFIINNVIPIAKEHGYNINIDDIFKFIYDKGLLKDEDLYEISGGGYSFQNIAISTLTALLTSITSPIIANDKPTQMDINNDTSTYQSLEYFKQVQQPYVGYYGNHKENLRHRGTYLRLADIDKNSLSPEESVAFDEYTTTSSEINYRLRNDISKDDSTESNISIMKDAFSNHKVKIDLTSYRGVTDGMISFLFNEISLNQKTKDLIYNKDKSINHQNLYKYKLYKLLENVTFKDKAFVSTTTNEFFAERWANELCHRDLAEAYKKAGDTKASEAELSKHKIFTNIEGSHIMELSIPKGTEAMFVDTMYLKTNFPRGQNEVTIGSGYLYKIKKVEPISFGRYKFYVDIIGKQ